MPLLLLLRAVIQIYAEQGSVYSSTSLIINNVAEYDEVAMIKFRCSRYSLIIDKVNEYYQIAMIKSWRSTFMIPNMQPWEFPIICLLAWLFPILSTQWHKYPAFNPKPPSMIPSLLSDYPQQHTMPTCAERNACELAMRTSAVEGLARASLRQTFWQSATITIQNMVAEFIIKQRLGSTEHDLS